MTDEQEGRAALGQLEEVGIDEARAKEIADRFVGDDGDSELVVEAERPEG